MSASSFSQALIPLGLAFRLYDAFSSAVQRKCTCLVLRSLAGNGGLPLPRLVVMAQLWGTQIILAISTFLLYSVYTLNQEAEMDQIREIANKANAARARANAALANQDLAKAKEEVENARKADEEFFQLTGRRF